MIMTYGGHSLTITKQHVKPNGKIVVAETEDGYWIVSYPAASKVYVVKSRDKAREMWASAK